MPPPTIGEVARAAAREETHSAFRRLGFDLDDQDDTRKLFEILRWASIKQEKEIKASSTLTGVVFLFASAVIGSVTTAVVQFWASKGWGK